MIHVMMAPTHAMAVLVDLLYLCIRLLYIYFVSDATWKSLMCLSMIVAPKIPQMIRVRVIHPRNSFSNTVLG